MAPKNSIDKNTQSIKKYSVLQNKNKNKMKKLPITLLSAAAVANGISWRSRLCVHLNYEEYDDRVSAMTPWFRLKSIGLDWTPNAEISYDSVSGASPACGALRRLLLRCRQQIAPWKPASKLKTKLTKSSSCGLRSHRDSYEVQKVGLEDTRKALAWVPPTVTDCVMNGPWWQYISRRRLREHWYQW